jgi:hypothetical protein
MGLFFKRWDEINSTYDPLWHNDKTPRWYDKVKTMHVPEGKIFKEMQEEQAKEYVRQYIKNSMGIDHTKVEAWLVGIIRAVHAGIYSYEEVFGTPAGQYNTWASISMAHLQQVVSLLPIKSHLSIIKKNLNMLLFIFTFLAGIPLLLVQIIMWIKNLFQKKPLSFIYLSKKTTLTFLYISCAMFIAYFVVFFIGEWNKAASIDFPGGKWYPLQTTVIVSIIAFIFSFLGFWAATIFVKLTKEEVGAIRAFLKKIKYEK